MSDLKEGQTQEEFLAEQLQGLFDLLDSLKDEEGLASNYLLATGHLVDVPFTILVARNDKALETGKFLENLFKM